MIVRKTLEQAKAEAVVARVSQVYTWNKAGGNAVLDFGDWEGPVDIYSQYGTIRSFQSDFAGEPKLDLEKVIFAFGFSVSSETCLRIAFISCSCKGTGRVPEPTKLVTPGVLRTTYHASSLMTISTST